MKRRGILFFYIIILLLFVLSPFILNYKIFLHPQITYGQQIATKTEKYELDAIVVYSANGKIYRKEFNSDMLKNKQIRLVYNKQNPDEVIAFSVNSLYLSSKMLFLDFLFILVSAVFFTIRQTHDIDIGDL